MKLISMTEKVLELHETESVNSMSFYKILRYANLLSQKLELWMFVPCKLVDGVWVVLEEPDRKNKKYRMIVGEEKQDILDLHSFDSDLKEYQEAKDRVLFEGFQVDYDRIVINKEIRIQFNDFSIYLNDSSTVISIIEDLVKYNLELIPTAQKQLP